MINAVIKRTLPFLILCFALLCPLWAEETKTVLIINSYSPDFDWTRSTYEGILEGLSSLEKDYTVHTEYLDWKRFPSSEHVAQLLKISSAKYAHTAVDIIITTDDKALEFALDLRRALFPEIPLVFTGVLEESAPLYVTGERNVTGIYETLDPVATIRNALSMCPKAERIYVVNEKTESGIAIERSILTSIRAEFPSIPVFSLSDLPQTYIEQSAALMRNTDIILIGAYFVDIDGTSYTGSELARRISYVSAVPVHVVYLHQFGTGAVGGSLVWGSSMGKEAGRIACDILLGKDIGEIPSHAYKDFTPTYDANVLARFGIPRSRLPENAVIMNRIIPFFEQYPFAALLLAIVFALLLAIIGLLLYFTRKGYRLAYRDTLTGLVNKANVFATADHYLAATDNGKKAGLLYIDIDNFRMINDTFGHDFGDMILLQIAGQLSSLFPHNARIARFGADEFLILMKNCDGRELKAHAESVLSLFLEKMRIHGRDLFLTVSIGAAVYPDHGREFRPLLQSADTAMHKAKNAGKTRCVFFDYTMAADLSHWVEIESGLRVAEANGELFVVYQPQVSLLSGRVEGFEALVRWKHPHKGFIPPSVFIPVAENSAQIEKIGIFVLKSALAFIREARAQGKTGFTVSVNVSAKQLSDPEFPSQVLAIMKEEEIGSDRVVFEITESILMSALDTAMEGLTTLRNEGFLIALDDFGTGYSSINYLRELPVNTVKMDKSFIDNMLTDARSKPLTALIIDLCKELGLKTVAEGVESREQVDFLMTRKCDIIQGYYFSKPERNDVALALLDRNFLSGTPPST